MRTVTGYRDGHPLWSENVPAENVGWGHTLGGRAVEPAPSEADRRNAQQAAYNRKIRGLRGAKLK
jgi:hypothetical protein